MYKELCLWYVDVLLIPVDMEIQQGIPKTKTGSCTSTDDHDPEKAGDIPLEEGETQREQSMPRPAQRRLSCFRKEH